MGAYHETCSRICRAGLLISPESASRVIGMHQAANISAARGPVPILQANV